MRVTTDFWASALVRRVFSDGGFAAIVRRGAFEAGAVFIVTRDRMGHVTLYAPASQAAYDAGRPMDRRFTLVGEGLDQAAVDARIAKEMRFDSDVWVIEIEPGATSLPELVDLTTP